MGADKQVALGAITESLKQVLKRKRVTYAQAADALGVSEQTIKRLFAGDDFPMSRLLELCEFAGTSVFDLMELARKDDGEKTFQLSPEQEQFFADYPHYFLFFNELRSEATPDQVRAKHGISERSMRRYLKVLEEFGLLERLEGNRIKMTKEGGLNLRKNGPMSLKISLDFAGKLLKWVAKANAVENPKATNWWTMSDALMSPNSVAEMKKELEELVGRYRKLAQREHALLPRESLAPAAWAVVIASPYEHKFDEAIIDL